MASYPAKEARAMTTTETATLIPHALPTCPNARIILFAMRRMGAHGIGDARVGHLFFSSFGQAFRRPLTLMRTLMIELASGAAGTIAIAPCCCARMTTAEAALLTTLARIETQPDSARFLMSDLLGTRRVEPALMAAAAVAAAFADEGRPIA